MIYKFTTSICWNTHELMNDSYRAVVSKRNKFSLLFWLLSKANITDNFTLQQRWVRNYHMILKNKGSIYDGEFRRCQFCATPCYDVKGLERHL